MKPIVGKKNVWEQEAPGTWAKLEIFLMLEEVQKREVGFSSVATYVERHGARQYSGRSRIN